MAPYPPSGFPLRPDTNYFLYIGEIKNYGLNFFLKHSLDHIYQKTFDFIAVVPDSFEQYDYENIIVHSPDSDQGNCCRIASGSFISSVCKNREIRELIHHILQTQSTLFIYMFESSVEMTLDEIEGVTVLGPDKHVARKLNSKTHQLTSLKSKVPVPEFQICGSYEEMIQTCRRLWNHWSDGIFVSRPYSAAGAQSMVASNEKEIEKRFNQTPDTYIVSRFIPHRYDPTVLGVVASENEVYIAGVADQRIEGGNRFTGSTYPSMLDESIRSRLIDTTRTVGKWMATQGYRGIFGCDYVISLTGEIFFVEINARKQGTTMEFCCTLACILPPSAPNLTWLEHDAVIHGKFPDTAVEPDLSGHHLPHWGTYNIKTPVSVRTNSYIPHPQDELGCFQKVASGRLKKTFQIMEHPGADILVTGGTFLSRIVSVGESHQSVSQGIELARRIVEMTISQSETE